MTIDIKRMAWPNHSPVRRADDPLIAACRAIVAARLGDAVEVPGELVQR